jgi:hypothetical protein
MPHLTSVDAWPTFEGAVSPNAIERFWLTHWATFTSRSLPVSQEKRTLESPPPGFACAGFGLAVNVAIAASAAPADEQLVRGAVAEASVSPAVLIRMKIFGIPHLTFVDVCPTFEGAAGPTAVEDCGPSH